MSTTRTRLGAVVIAIVGVALIVAVLLFVRERARVREYTAERNRFCTGVALELDAIARMRDTHRLEQRMRVRFLDPSLLRFCTGNEAPYSWETRAGAERCASDAPDNADHCYLALARELAAACETAVR